MFFASGSIGRRKALMSVSFSSANADWKPDSKSLSGALSSA
jgi:hypothetical protein